MHVYAAYFGVARAQSNNRDKKRAIRAIGHLTKLTFDTAIMTQSPALTTLTVNQPSADTLTELQVASWPIWTKEISEFSWTYADDETCFFIAGEVIVTPEGGEPTLLKKGDLVTFPAGMSCTWKIIKDVRKHYCFG